MQTGRISNFQSRFVSSRGQATPTGEPLYSYRMTREEFDGLESGIREFLVHHLKYARPGRNRSREVLVSGSLCRLRSGVVATGVRRLAWSWEPILLRLGAPPDGWNQAQRSECVEIGLADWKIPVAESRGFRFLGSVAAQAAAKRDKVQPLGSVGTRSGDNNLSCNSRYDLELFVVAPALQRFARSGNLAAHWVRCLFFRHDYSLAT